METNTGHTGSNDTEKLSFPSLAGYGIGDLFGGGSFVLIGAFYMFYLTQTVGLSPSTAGLIFALGKVWDAISDPLMGALSDRTRSRFGRRRVFFLLAPVPVFLSFFMMWLPVSGGRDLTALFYYGGSYLFFNTVFTMVMVPYSAINAEITSSYRERTRLSGARMIFSQISALLSATLPMLIISASDRGYQIMAAVFGALYASPWLIVFFSTRENCPEEAPSPLSPGIVFKQFISIFSNSSFRRLTGMYICAYTAMDIMMALFIYVLTYSLNMKAHYSAAMGSLVITQLLMLPLYVKLANRKGKGAAYRRGLIIWAGALSSVFLLNESSPVWMLVIICITIGSGEIAGVFVPWAVLPSVIDVDELICGDKRSGTYSGAMTMIRKMVQGLGAMPLVGFLLEMVGFREGGVVPENLLPLKILFILVPAGFILLGIFISLGFKITPRTHSILSDELTRLRDGGDKDLAKASVKEVCEELSGMGWEKLYPVKG
ncbi:MAG: MFS transporter [Spirochaetales bacterium]|nr:MFS transporter [Spirochaetales bacterium]